MRHCTYLHMCFNVGNNGCVLESSARKLTENVLMSSIHYRMCFVTPIYWHYYCFHVQMFSSLTPALQLVGFLSSAAIVSDEGKMVDASTMHLRASTIPWKNRMDLTPQFDSWTPRTTEAGKYLMLNSIHPIGGMGTNVILSNVELLNLECSNGIVYFTIDTRYLSNIPFPI